MLKNKEKAITSDELATFFGVSSRTIRNDINLINQITSNRIESSYLGFKLVEYDDMLDSLDESGLPNQRRRNILKELLIHSFIDLSQLSDEIYVSVQTIITDIKAAEEWLLKFNLSLRRKNYKYFLEGDEADKRRLFRVLLEEEVTGNFMDVGKICQLFNEFDMQYVIDVFQRKIEQENFKFNGVAYHMVLIHIGIAISRMIDGYYATENMIAVQEDSMEYAIAATFFNSVKDELQIEIAENEVRSLTQLLVGNKMMADVESYSNEIREFCSEAISILNQEYSLDLICDEELILGLTMHIQSMLLRQKHQVNIRNVLLSDIKNNYPLTFEMSIKFCQLLEKRYNIRINENEIGFIALHIGVGYERQQKKQVFPVLLIYPYQNSLSLLLKKRIEAEYSNRLSIELIADSYIEQSHSWAKFVISTLPVVAPCPVVMISSALSQSDLDSIHAMISQFDKKETFSSIEESLSIFFDKQLFLSNDDSTSPKEVIRRLSNLLVNTDTVTDTFFESVMERESISPTSFEQYFAVPHALILDAKRTKVAVSILKKPILWGDYSVKLVLLFAIAKEDRRMLKTLYDFISNVLLQKDTFEKLVQVSLYEEFKKILIESSTR